MSEEKVPQSKEGSEKPESRQTSGGGDRDRENRSPRKKDYRGKKGGGSRSGPKKGGHHGGHNGKRINQMRDEDEI